MLAKSNTDDFVRCHKIEKLLALRGKINIEYDWEKEEELEVSATEELK
jgi:hypothetical protein